MSSIAAPPAPVRTIPAPHATASSPVPGGQGSHRLLYTRLQHDWMRLCASASVLDRARSWPLPIGQVESLDDVLRSCGYGRVGRCTEHHDDVLVRLVCLAKDDELAARVVLQRILPGLWSMVRQRTRCDADPRDVREQDDEVLATAWTVIRCFRTEHRRDFVVARMLKEIEYRTFRLPKRRLATFVSTPPHELDRPVPSEPLDDPALLLDLLLRAAARRGLTDAELTMLRQWGAGMSAAALATASAVTERTVRNHRHAVLRRLQQLIGDDPAAVTAAVTGAGDEREDRDSPDRDSRDRSGRERQGASRSASSASQAR